MKAAQIDDALQTKFFEDGERLVWWRDEPGEFRSYIEAGLSGPLADVQVIDVNATGGLATKLKVDRDDLEGKYLLYADGPAPKVEHDFLVDVRYYSGQFHADLASLWLQELGLGSLSLRSHLELRSDFLKSQDRRKRLTRLLEPKDGPTEIDLKMIAVLTGSGVAAPFEVLQGICQSHTPDADQFDLTDDPAVMGQLEKYGLATRFWELMDGTFGYQAATPTISGLLRSVFISELLADLGDAGPASLQHHQLKSGNGRREAGVFLTRWRDSNTAAASYDAATEAVAAEQNIAATLAEAPLDAVRRAFTFEATERRVLAALKDRVLADGEMIDLDWVERVIGERRTGHWIGGPGRSDPEAQALGRSYDAIQAAVQLFKLHAEHRGRFAFDSGPELLDAYRKGLFQFDRVYRDFQTAAAAIRGQGWNLLKDLGDAVERLYDQGFLQPLGVEWSRLLDEGFLDVWTDEACPAQSKFYAQVIGPMLARSDRKRAFVIISDAFRYEAAVELTEKINRQDRREAEVSPMLGVVPSYTSLGMAALLPHETLGFDDRGEVLADGRSTAGLAGRNRQLESVGGMACQASELIQMKVDEARAFIGEAKVVYIYHNVIEARGDSAATEDETFAAVSDCIAELSDLAKFCINRLSASTVWITADHGFLYQSTPPGETDRSVLEMKPEEAFRTKKRYVLGRDLGETSQAHHGSVATTANATGEVEFWVPRSTSLFHFTGGARFVHGGAMPQEVMVPLVRVAGLRGEKAEESRVDRVGVQILGSNHKITTPQYRFEIIQTDAVSDRRRPVTVHAAIYEGANPVSSIEKVAFDSTSASLDDRKKQIRFELQSGTFDKSTPYRLILRDVENDAEIQSAPVVIDRSFDDDF